MLKLVLVFILLLFQPSCFILTITGLAVGGAVKTIEYGVSGAVSTVGAVSKSVASSAKKSEHRVAEVLRDGTWIAAEPYDVETMWKAAHAGFKEFRFKKVSGNFKSSEGFLTGIYKSGDIVDVKFEGLDSGTKVSVLWGEGGNEEMSKKMLDFLAHRLNQIESNKK